MHKFYIKLASEHSNWHPNIWCDSYLTNQKLVNYYISLLFQEHTTVRFGLNIYFLHIRFRCLLWRRGSCGLDVVWELEEVFDTAALASGLRARRVLIASLRLIVSSTTSLLIDSFLAHLFCRHSWSTWHTKQTECF